MLKVLTPVVKARNKYTSSNFGGNSLEKGWHKITIYMFLALLFFMRSGPRNSGIHII